MKERPIMMTPENAQKCHEGTKTQTRRIVKVNDSVRVRAMGTPKNWHLDDPNAVLACPYGLVMDRLWVRENGWERPARTLNMLRDGADTWDRFYFDALLDVGEAEELKGYGFKRRSSIHMPRFACRTVLEITEVRVERLQEISEDECLAEGIQISEYVTRAQARPLIAPMFKQLWESIHGVGSWEKNPWVWVISFGRLQVGLTGDQTKEVMP